MAVRIQGPDDIEQRRVSPQRGIVNIEADPMGQVFENLGERGARIAQGLRDTQIESQVLGADMKARSELDQLIRKIETGADPTQFEAQYLEGAQAILNRHGEGMAPDSRRVWERRAAERLSTGVIASRESAQRRMLDDARASVRTLTEEADGIIQNPESDDAQREGALETVRLAVRKAQERGLLGADDGALFVTGVEGRLEQHRRTAGLTASALAATDTIFADNASLDERLEAARQIENPALRVAVENMVMQRQANDNAARNDRMDQAYGHIAAGEAIPPALWQGLSGRDQASIQDYIRHRSRAIAEGAEAPRDRALISDLNVLAVSDPAAFARRDLQEVRGRLGEGAYQALAQEQARIRQGGARSGASEQTLRSALNSGRLQLRAAGYPLTADGGLSADAEDEDAERLIEFQSDLIGLLDRFVEENHRQPNVQEQLGAVQSLLTQHETPGGFLGFGRREFSQTETYVPYTQIPANERTRIEGRLRAGGLAVSRGNVERYYEQERIDRTMGNR